jgi:AcrR family transcriptional regulator
MSIEQRREGRARILEGARRILEGGEMGAFTVDALARGLHMSKSTLYKYFDGKDHVLVVLVDEICDQAAAAFGAAGDLGDLDTLGSLLADHEQRMPGALVLDEDELPSQSVARLVEVRERFLVALSAALPDGVQEGALDVQHPDVVAASYLAAAEAAVAATAAGLGGASRREAVLATHRTFARGLARGLAAV